MSFQYHSNCDQCGSSDALGVWPDHVHCFSCNYHSTDTDNHEPVEHSKYPSDLVSGGDFKSFRGITVETCKHFNYRFKYNPRKEAEAHIAPYYDSSGVLKAQHLRYPNKELPWRGNNKEALPMFGQHKIKTKGKHLKRLVICEGEIDAMSVSQAFSNNWPVVGIAGVQSAPKIFKKHIELLEAYESVVIAFDGDDAGRTEATKCAELLSAGKAYICQLPDGKDMNDILQERGAKSVCQLVYDAVAYQPDGIVLGKDLKNKLTDWFKGTNRPQCLTLPRSILNEKTKGIRKGELVMLTAGTGIGKSTEANEWLYHLEQVEGQRVGLIALEESTVRTSLRYLSMHMNKPLHLLPVDENGSLRGVPEKDFEEAYEKTVGNGNYALYDHFGALDSESLVSKLRYLATGLDCDFILLDHITIAISLEEDQLSSADRLMNNLRSLIEQTGVGVIAICHLRKTDSKQTGFESGGEISLDNLKGSGSLKQIPDTIIAIERDQQADNPNRAKTRILKCRYTGETGLADQLIYDPETGRIKEHIGDFEDDDITGEEDPDF